MSRYVAQLNADVSRDHAQRVEASNAEARERLTTLEDRLVRLLRTIPVELQREGLPIATLQASLRGRWRGNCHPGELGSALRRLGFERRRSWKKGEGFSARWFQI